MTDLNPETRSHTISDVRNGAIPFLPFLERGGVGEGRGGTEQGEGSPPQFGEGASKIATLLLLWLSDIVSLGISDATRGTLASSFYICICLPASL